MEETYRVLNYSMDTPRRGSDIPEAEHFRTFLSPLERICKNIGGSHEGSASTHTKQAGSTYLIGEVLVKHSVTDTKIKTSMKVYRTHLNSSHWLELKEKMEEHYKKEALMENANGSRI
jgi:hypothetical protein